jgi:Zn-finger nucleic acid-binding protein
MPSGLHVDFCTGCHGFWFDKGELMIYESFLEKKRQRFRKSEEEKRARKRQLEQMPVTASEIVLKFLNTNVQRGFF